MTIRQLAPKIGTTGFAMAKEFKLPRNVDKDTPLAKLGVEQGELDEVAAHLLSHRGRSFKYFVFAALSLLGLVWLVRLGRPDGSPNAERKTWYPRAPYVVVLLLAVAVCGFALGKSPNPMEGAVKIFKGCTNSDGKPVSARSKLVMAKAGGMPTEPWIGISFIPVVTIPE